MLIFITNQKLFLRLSPGSFIEEIFIGLDNGHHLEYCGWKIITRGEAMFEDCTVWKVVVNLEDQYSIWPASKMSPSGWKDAAKEGSKEECLTYIKEVWVDMRPRSLKKVMERKNRNFL